MDRALTEKELAALNAISEGKGNATISQLADAEGIGYHSMRTRILRLEECGLVEEYAADKSSRAPGQRGKTPNTLGLTDAGKAERTKANRKAA